MSRVIIFLVWLCGASSGSILVRVLAPVERLPANLDIVGRKPGKGVDVVVDDKGFSELTVRGLETEVLIPDLEQYLKSVALNYRSLAEIQAFIDSTVSRYPAIAKKFALGTTYEGRTIWALKISDNVATDEAEPALLFMGLHHAREWPTVEICLFYADTLTRGYGKDPVITDIVNNREIWIVPCVNPDGYHYSHDLGNDWRKNRRYFPEFKTYGVDLNRNYNTSGNGVDRGEWGSITQTTTHFPDYPTYCGPEPFSEPETKAVRDLTIANNPIFSVSYHTYSELVLWPWGYSVYDTVPDNSVARAIGIIMASLITRQDGEGSYTPEQSSLLYTTTGDSDDWLYGFSFYTRSRNLLAYTVEACSMFIPPAMQLAQIVRANFAGARYLCLIADSIENLLTPPVVCSKPDGPDSVSGNFTLTWTVKNQKSQPQYFQLEELLGEIVTDDAETGAGWVLNNFSLSSKAHHSGNFSFHSFEQGSNLTGSATTEYPVFINHGDSLSFWCTYDIEENFDYAMVEVSEDGRDWTILEGFTGNSGGWKRRAYSLEPYEQSSIFIRFRYTVDDEMTLGGFYVDDIYPVARYSQRSILDSNIYSPIYAIPSRNNGTYYYRVKGFNCRGEGDYSPLKRVVVTGAAVVENRRTGDEKFRFAVEPRISNGEFSLSFWIPRSGHIRLSVFNAAGENVLSPVKRWLKKGNYQEKLNLSLPAGVYFLRFESSGFNAITKIILVK